VGYDWLSAFNSRGERERSLYRRVPTVVKAWVKPWTETMSGWLLMILELSSVLWQFRSGRLDSGFLPVVIGLLQLSVALPLVLYTLNGSVRK